ncbi:DUF5825 family protein [Streptomyces clavuligerus]|uniref:Uncharacterized protein n=1 Tax=Streptomyces clavuligerus TaxID=1901 RepID=B5H1I3_STRCL|nr:DUF5825 family protein [Streptomyces clavuligerus]ANW22497.1 hypothetical protein BB341_29750 [Streptomyces clavuligerus]AXU16996.1 hypothetical protein D1794_30290 [Streptomyces clavuligerus]AXU17396.1 hypothetical protein D1794_32885 [Streptomyces clavuligerus]EDY52429.1 conserved hypothetical protein [Streptomyces clavuligerus]EFG04617.1 Hypothetical protein SCLAV_p1131 [Streptomyces clavuligerus]
MSTALSPSAVLAWRDYDPAACELPGMFLGELTLPGPLKDEGERLWQLGVRRVRLPAPVDLTDVMDPARAADAVAGLSLVRDLTARAVLVEWELRLDPAAAPDAWAVLNHLQPPWRLSGPEGCEDTLRTWRQGHYLCKCLWRKGPGFIQIRDRRWGELRRFTADEPLYETTIERLAYGAPADSVPAAVLDDFRNEQLVLDVGPLAWWIPYRISRWLQESMTI